MDPDPQSAYKQFGSTSLNIRNISMKSGIIVSFTTRKARKDIRERLYRFFFFSERALDNFIVPLETFRKVSVTCFRL